MLLGRCGHAQPCNTPPAQAPSSHMTRPSGQGQMVWCTARGLKDTHAPTDTVLSWHMHLACSLPLPGLQCQQATGPAARLHCTTQQPQVRPVLHTVLLTWWYTLSRQDSRKCDTSTVACSWESSRKKAAKPSPFDSASVRNASRLGCCSAACRSSGSSGTAASEPGRYWVAWEAQSNTKSSVEIKKKSKTITHDEGNNWICWGRTQCWADRRVSAEVAAQGTLVQHS